MSEPKDGTMGYAEDVPCAYCGTVGFTWKVEGRGLSGYYHPPCMWAALLAKHNTTALHLTGPWEGLFDDRVNMDHHADPGAPGVHPRRDL